MMKVRLIKDLPGDYWNGKGLNYEIGHIFDVDEEESQGVFMDDYFVLSEPTHPCISSFYSIHRRYVEVVQETPLEGLLDMLSLVTKAVYDHEASFIEELVPCPNGIDEITFFSMASIDCVVRFRLHTFEEVTIYIPTCDVLGWFDDLEDK